MTFHLEGRRLRIQHKQNTTIADVKSKVMSYFNIGHLIEFINPNEVKLKSSYVLKKDDVIKIITPRINFREFKKFFICLKTKGSDEKLIRSFKTAMSNTYHINESDFTAINISRLSLGRSQITFEIVSQKLSCNIDFQKNLLYLQKRRLKIKPLLDNM